MALQIVTGASGAGKSYIVYEDLIREATAQPERNFLVLVPEQFTMQTQADLVDSSPRRGLLNVDVLSFNRLAHRVFAEVGGNTRPILDDTGKSLVVQRVISRKKDELGVLARTLVRRGSAEQMKSLISELLAYRVEPDDLDDWIREASARRILAGKLEDVRMIYRDFCAYLSDRYLTTEEVLQVLCGVIGDSELIRGSEVVLDGFTGFTPIQHQVIRELLALCEKVTVVVTIDDSRALMEQGGPQRLFRMSCEMAQKLAELAREAGTEILPVREIAPGPASRFAGNAELRFLEEHLFRFSKETYSGAPKRICLSEAADPAEEVQYIAEVIQKKIREEGCRYRDFALVTGDLGMYGRLAGEIFEEAGIPCFIDQKLPVWTNALVEYIVSAMDMLVQRFSYESVFRFLRCAFSAFDAEETDRLENYVLALGIRGQAQYREPWLRQSKRTSPEELQFLNTLRERFYKQTEKFAEGMRSRGATVEGKTKVLYELLTENDLQGKCAAAEQRAKERDEQAAAREYAQIYPRVIDMLDKLVEVLGDEKMSMADYQELLLAGFEELRLGLVPPGEDQVLVGDIERTRLKHIRYLFIAGVNEGIIPHPVAANGILSDADREFLQERRIELSPTAREEMYRQRFYLYLNMTKPSGELHLSYSRSSGGGGSLVPSYLIGTIRRLFPDIKIRRLEQVRDPLWRLGTEAGRREILFSGLQNLERRDAVFSELCRQISGTEEGKKRLRRLFDASAGRGQTGALGEAVARALYGKTLVNSATRLEQFAACAFAHFVRYGLRPAEREYYEFLPLDLGNIVHESLERFSEKLREAGLGWKEIGDAEAASLADRTLDEIVYAYGNTILQSSNRNSYNIARIRRVLQRTIWATKRQLLRGAFEPSAFEASFQERQDLASERLQLSDDVELQLVGRIDRLDICNDGDRRLVKVIDYKTGHMSFDLNALYEGLQLQLALYLNAAVELEQARHPELRVEPAGMYYFNARDPFIDPVSDEDWEKAMLMNLRMDGISRSEPHILQLLDRELAPGTSSSVVRVRLNRDGNISDSSGAADGHAFETIRRFTEQKARELGIRMISGEVGIHPYARSAKRACTWCKFKDICGFDTRVPGADYRRIPERDAGEILQLMEEKLS